MMTATKARRFSLSPNQASTPTCIAQAAISSAMAGSTRANRRRR